MTEDEQAIMNETVEHNSPCWKQPRKGILIPKGTHRCPFRTEAP